MKEQLRKLMRAVRERLKREEPDTPAKRWTKSFSLASTLIVNNPCAAEAPMRDALRIAEESFGTGNWRIFESMEKLLEILCVQQKVQEANELCDRLVESKINYYGSDHHKVIDLLIHLLWLLRSNYNLEKAEVLYKKAIPIFQEYCEQDEKPLLMALFGYGALCHEIEKYVDEQWALGLILGLAKKKKRASTELMVEVLLATSHAATGDFDMAEKLSETLENSLRKPYAEFEYEIAQEIPRLAGYCALSERFEQAENIHNLYMQIVESYKGKDSPDLLRGLSGLAQICYETGRLPETELLLRRAHAIREKAFFSEKVIDDSLSVNELVQFLDFQKRCDESEALLLEAAEKCEKIFGRISKRMSVKLHDLAALYQQHGKLKEAELTYSEVLEVNRKLNGPEASENIPALAELGKVLLMQNRYGEAKNHLLEALELYKGIGGAESPFLVDMLNSLGKTESAMGNYHNAEFYYSRQIAILEEFLSPKDPSLGPGLLGLGMALQSMERFSEAEKVYDRLLDIIEGDESLVKNGSHELAVTLKLKADIYLQQGRFAEAERHYFRALGILEKLGDDESLWLAGCVDCIARIKVEAGDTNEGAVYLERAIKIYEISGTMETDQLDDRKKILADLKSKAMGTQAWLQEEPGNDKDGSIH